ncbi:MAG: AraC family transcriptional regulator [Pseudomonadota bacterium]
MIDWLRRQRLALAFNALTLEGTSVTRAAEIAGYQSSTNFSTAFRKEYGYPPSHCRR